jgi:lysophospholipase L1-like esterase
MTPLERYLSLRDVPAFRKMLLVGFGVLLVLADLLPNVGLGSEALSLGIELVMGVTFLVIAMHDRLDQGGRAVWAHHLLAIVAALAVATGGAEAATRWIFRDVTTSADSGSFFSRRWLNDVSLNEYGFRERSFSLEKPSGKFRVAVMGDSFTFGNGIPREERYSDLLGKWLGDQSEVLNFGVPGDNTPHHAEMLESRILPASPHFVLLQWFVNDIEGDDLSQRPRPALLAPTPELHGWLNRHSALYAVANMRWADLQILLGWSPSYADYLKTRAGEPTSPDAVREAQLFHRMVETAHRNHADIAVVLFPDTGPPLDATYPFGFLHDRILDLCRAEGVQCVDLRQRFSQEKDRRSLWVSPFDHHPSAKANYIAAKELFHLLRNHFTR